MTKSKIDKVQPDQTTMVELATAEKIPQDLMELAISSGANVEVLEKIMGLQMKWEANVSRKKFFESLSAFQNDMPVVTKNKLVDYTGRTGIRTKYNYATLDNIISEIKPHLNKHGLTYRWEFEDSTKIVVKCIITHTSGHSECTTMSANLEAGGKMNAIQERGAVLTYLQRYTLIGALGIGTAQDDTDANDLHPAPESKKMQPNVQAGKPIITDAQLKKAAERITAGETTVLDKVKESFALTEDNIKELNYALDIHLQIIADNEAAMDEADGFGKGEFPS